MLWEAFREDCKTFSDWLVDVETEISDCDVTDISVEMTKEEIRKYEVCDHSAITGCLMEHLFNHSQLEYNVYAPIGYILEL